MSKMAAENPTYYYGETSSDDEAPDQRLLSLSLVNGKAFLAVCLGGGLRVFGCEPFREVYRRDGAAGLRVAEMLPPHNLWALSGAVGIHSRRPENKVFLWSEPRGRFVGQLTCRAPVVAVRACRDAVVAVMEWRVVVFGLKDLRQRRAVGTTANPRGLCVVSDDDVAAAVMVFLGPEEGQVRVELGCGATAEEAPRIVPAHDSAIACLALTQDGRFFATASVKGTLIRVFSTANGSLLQEVRRGADRAVIHSMAFSKDAEWLAVSSDKGTVHVFGLKLNATSSSHQNHHSQSSISPLSFIKGVLPKYFSSEWSMAQFRLPETSKSIVAFGHEKDTIVLLSANGSFYRCRFDPVRGGPMTQLEHHNFLDAEEST